MTHQRIFVQIASYRDPECQWTIKDLFAKAKYPERVFAGVCWQFVPGDDDDCFETSTRPDQVRVVEFHPSESRGVGWARDQAWSLWRDEEFILQIDSHMRFVEHWDVKMIDMLDRCDSPRAILSSYPPGYIPPDKLGDKKVAKLRCMEFLDSGVVTLATGGSEKLMASGAPSRQAFCAGGFLFAPAQAIVEVPHDSHIFFWGEEIAWAVRLWTAGWDLFAPNEVLIYHYYGVRDKHRRHNVGNPNARDLERLTTKRVKHLLGIEATDDPAALANLDKYGLGRERSLQEYEAFSGLNFGARTIAQYVKSWPYHLTEGAKNDRDTVRQNTKLADSAHAFVFEDSGVVFSETTQEIYHFNQAAMFVWCSLEDDEPHAGIVSMIASSLGLSEDQADVILTETLQHWWDIGLLASSPQLAAADIDSMRERLNITDFADAENFPEDSTLRNERVRNYQLLDASVRVLFETVEQEALIHPIIMHLEVDALPGEPDTIISLIERGETHFVYQNGKPHNHNREISTLGPMIKGLILQAGTNSQDYFMCVHSGVVTDGQTCILIPGESGRGKSSMTAAFTKAGFTFCSDEMALLVKGSFDVMALPAAMCIKESGFDTMEKLFPQISDLPIYDREDGKRVRYFLPPNVRIDGAKDNPMPVQRIIFPKYDPSQPARLTRMSKADALRIISVECMAIPSMIDQVGITQFVRWIRNIDCYELTVASLDDAVAMGTQLLAERQPAA